MLVKDIGITIMIILLLLREGRMIPTRKPDDLTSTNGHTITYSTILPIEEARKAGTSNVPIICTMPLPDSIFEQLEDGRSFYDMKNIYRDTSNKNDWYSNRKLTFHIDYDRDKM
jgi:hypothetical protein